jgi:DNA-binding PadR family transcriptional regulator
LKKKSEAEFNTVKDKTALSVGNLSIQLNKLKKEGYIEIQKGFKGNYPLTICKITEKGIKAVDDFFSVLESYRQLEDEIQTLSE